MILIILRHRSAEADRLLSASRTRYPVSASACSPEESAWFGYIMLAIIMTDWAHIKQDIICHHGKSHKRLCFVMTWSNICIVSRASAIQTASACCDAWWSQLAAQLLVTAFNSLKWRLSKQRQGRCIRVRRWWNFTSKKFLYNHVLNEEGVPVAWTWRCFQTDARWRNEDEEEVDGAKPATWSLM